MQRVARCLEQNAELQTELGTDCKDKYSVFTKMRSFALSDTSQANEPEGPPTQSLCCVTVLRVERRL